MVLCEGEMVGVWRCECGGGEYEVVGSGRSWLREGKDWRRGVSWEGEEVVQNEEGSDSLWCSWFVPSSVA